ncbi:MAG: hypothetical protein AAGD32_15470 [Planctomycetota bacterium]
MRLILESLGAGVCVFAICKILFMFAGWYTEDKEDRLYRSKLADIWKRLHSLSLYELWHAYFARLVRKTRNARLFSFRNIIIAFLFFVILNYTSFLTANAIAVVAEDGESFFGKTYRMLAAGSARDYVGILCISLIVAAYDMCSLAITWALVKAAGRALTIAAILRDIAVDCVLVFCGGFICLTATIMVAAPQVMSDYFNFLRVYVQAEPMLVLSLFVVVGLTSAIPSALYLILLITVTVMRFMPERIEHIVRRLIGRVTSDKQPILRQLGNVLGAIGCVATAILEILAG